VYSIDPLDIEAQIKDSLNIEHEIQLLNISQSKEDIH
jgi:hypothetical protein